MEHWQQQNSCYICLNEDLLCCSEKVDVNSEILQLLKFLIVNVNIEALENVVVGTGCLKKIGDTCEYKYKNLRVSSKILQDKISDSEESIICQKCETVFHRNDASLLVDCVKHIDWLDFINYLFENSDMEYLEKSYICNSCRISVSSIQHILKLLYIYDQSKIQFIVNNCEDSKVTGNKDSAEREVTIKEEIYSNDLIKNEPTEIIMIPNDDYDYLSYENFKLKNEEIDLIENKPVEIVPIPYDDHDYFNFNYENFKIKNEEIDLKLECSNCDNPDTEQSTHGYEKVEKENEVNYLEKNDLEKLKQNNFFVECEIDSITNQLKKHPSRDNVDGNKFTCHSKKNIENELDFKHTYSTKKPIKKLKFDDNIAKKIFLEQYRLKYYVKNNSKIFKCQCCPYETCQKDNLIKHIKQIGHQNIKEFKCAYCLKQFAYRASLDTHVLKIHKYREIRKKYNCDQCSYKCQTKRDLLRHKIKQCITDGIPIFKCYECTFETYYKSYFVKHLKQHENFKNFKSTLKLNLDDNMAKKIFLRQRQLENNSQIFKCQYCPYETCWKSSLIRHIKIHQNIKEFKCTYCLQEFKQKCSLERHLFRIHKYRDVKKKLYNCDQCSHECLFKIDMLRHKIKHGITDGIPILKCHYCLKEFIRKNSLERHLFRIHKYRDVRKKLYSCVHCSYECLFKNDMLRHKIKHKKIKDLCTLSPKELAQKIKEKYF